MSNTTPYYWDCECEEDFIHAKSIGNFCPICGKFEHEQPDSHDTEVVEFYQPRKDTAVRRTPKEGR